MDAAVYSNAYANCDDVIMDDMDMDIDLTIEPEITALEQEALEIEPQVHQQSAGFGATSQFVVDPTSTEAVPEKVHVRGLDNLSTEDIKTYANEHFQSPEFVRIEWIDDTSANVVYRTAEAASQALAALTNVAGADPSVIPPLQLRIAKRLSTHPDAELQVRHAVATDVKRRKAHEASRYYLMNPDKDPRGQDRQFDGRRRRGRRGSDENGEFRRRRFDDAEHKRRRRDEGNTGFDVDMYDDDAGENGSRRRSPESETAFSEDRRVRRGKGDLFSGRKDGRLRDRSASPDREGDGRFGFDEDVPARRTARRRSFTPPRQRRGNAGKELFAEKTNSTTALTSNTGKELFPSSRSTGAAMDGGRKELFPNSGSSSAAVLNNGKELFPSRKEESNARKELFPGGASPIRRELFPHRTPHSNHRRTDAFDAVDESGPLYSPTDVKIRGKSKANGGDLTDRITGGPVASSNGSISIKGSSTKNGGFSIRGASNEVGGNVGKELFPLKSGGGLETRIKGRGAPRTRAEDMFG